VPRERQANYWASSSVVTVIVTSEVPLSTGAGQYQSVRMPKKPAVRIFTAFALIMIARLLS
jgi:hypothetical protein